MDYTGFLGWVIFFSFFSQHDYGPLLHTLYHKIHLCRCKLRENSPNHEHLESVEHKSYICWIRFSVKILCSSSEQALCLCFCVWYEKCEMWNMLNPFMEIMKLMHTYLCRYHQIALNKMRKLFTIVMGTTFAAVACWTVLTFFGESVS